MQETALKKEDTMSVTFSLALSDADLAGFEVYDHENEVSHHADNYEHAKQLWSELNADPCGWSLSPKWNVSDEHDVNMANSNARELLTYLGLETDDLCGTADADDLTGRCLVAMALAPDVELIPTVQHGEQGARLIDLGRAKGYVPAKLEALLELCRFAKEQGRSIQWG
jgi:hypothetical protein